MWPEISPSEWREATARIARVAGAVLREERQPPTLAGDPVAIGIAAYISGTGPLLGYWIEEQRIVAGDGVDAVLSEHLRHNRIRTRNLNKQSQRAVAALLRHDVQVTVLKGMHTALAYYPEPAVRPMVDIDLLIDANDEERAARALIEEGFSPGRTNPFPRQQTWKSRGGTDHPRSVLLLHQADPWSIDLHCSISRRYSAGSDAADLDRLVRLGAAPRWALDRGAAVLPQPLLTLFHACHSSCEFSSLTLGRLIEIVLIVRRDRTSKALCWEELRETGERTRALGFAYPALSLCEKLVKGTVPREILAAARQSVPRRALEFIDRLEPSTAHRVDRCSWEERFMWLTSPSGLMRQLAFDIFLPSAISASEVWQIYRRRARRLMRGGVTRR